MPFQPAVGVSPIVGVLAPHKSHQPRLTGGSPFSHLPKAGRWANAWAACNGSIGTEDLIKDRQRRSGAAGRRGHCHRSPQPS